MRDLLDLNTESLNIRYLAWKENPDSNEWPDVLRRKAGLSRERARSILDGFQSTKDERAAIIEGFGIEGDAFGSARLLGLSRREIFKMNVKYLIAGLPQGEQKKLAEALHVAKETVSRWAKGRVPPSSRNISQMMRYLGLDLDLDLGEIPLFLSSRPIGQFAQRGWLRKQLDKLPSAELSKLFPALERLFGHHEDR